MRLCQNSLDICCCFNSPILTGNELSWCLLWPFEWTVPLLCATPFAVPLTVPFVVPLLFTVPFRCLRSPFFCKQTRFIYIHRYQSFWQENQSRLLHIFLDALVCNEIRDNHMGIIHYAILSWEFKHRGNFHNLLKTKFTYIYMQYIIYIIFSDLQAHLMFHFLIISKTQSSSIYVFLVATTYSGFNLLSYLLISYKVNVHLHHNITNSTLKLP